MKKQLVVAVAATLAATEYPVAGFNSPFLVGNEVTLVITKTGDFAGGDITVRTDNSESGGSAVFETIRAAADGDAATTKLVETYNIKLGDNIEITAAAVTAGGFDVELQAAT